MSKTTGSRSSQGVGELAEVTALARRALEPGLDVDETGRPISGGSCLHASVLLSELITKFTEWTATIRGGSGEGCTGAVDVSGEWHGHYWVEAERDGTTVAVDVTGDQFGHEPVRILDIRESRWLLMPGPQDVVDAAASDLKREIDAELGKVGRP